MNSNKYEYFLNVMHYCLWLNDMKFGDFVERLVNTLFYPIHKYLFTEEFRKEYNERKNKEKSKIDKFFYNKKNGYHIGWAHHWYGYFYSGYSAFLSFILLGVLFRFYGEVNRIIIFLVVAFPVILCYIPAYRAVFTKDRYLKYFKLFEKEDEQWHRKWKRTTMAFCIGSVITGLLGIGAMWCILLL